MSLPNAFCFHVLISGFNQHSGKGTGMSRLLEKFRADCHYCNGSSITELYRWDHRWDWLAQDIWRTSNYGDRTPLVNIYAYSWGAGWGSIRLARNLLGYGIKVNTMVLSDPVYRHPWIALRWLSMIKRKPFLLGSRVITIPSNVGQVHSFRQEMNLPQGHHLICDGDNTKLHSPVLLQRIHTQMDDATEFHDSCLEEAQSLRLLQKNHNSGPIVCADSCENPKRNGV